MTIATATTTTSGTARRCQGLLFIDASALEAELREAIRGEVRFDAGSRALYATDGSNYRQVPIGVVIPDDRRRRDRDGRGLPASTARRSSRAAAARA